MSNDMTVGWIGLGDQGAPMARAIAEEGFELHTWARRSSSLEQLDGVAYTAHDTPAALAERVDMLALCLNVDADIEDLMTSRGVLAALRPGSMVVNHGTGLPAFATHLSAIAEPFGVDTLDAPVSGGRAGAVARTLTTMVGGHHATFDRAAPVFEAFSSRVTHIGGIGTGQVTKLLNNALLMANQDNLRLLLSVADSLGVEVQPLADIIRTGTGTSRALESLGSAITSDNAEHLREMQVVDMDIFTDAVSHISDVARPLSARAYDGAAALPTLARRIR